MIQFRLRDLFAILIVVGLVLVWAIQPGNGISASALLAARKISETLAAPLSTIDSRPTTDEELVKTLGLEEWTETPEWIGSPYSFNRGMTLKVDVPWLDSSVSYYWESNTDVQNRTFRVVWNADWDSIEKRQKLTQRQIAIRTVVTGIMGICLVWLYVPRKNAT